MRAALVDTCCNCLESTKSANKYVAALVIVEVRMPYIQYDWGVFSTLFVKSLVVMVGTTDLLLFVHSDLKVDGNCWIRSRGHLNSRLVR